MQDWIKSVKPGHKLRPKPLWNNTENQRKQLHAPTDVLGVMRARGCETGVMFKVRFKDKSESWLDAAWFCKPTTKYPLGALTDAAEDKPNAKPVK